MSNHAFALSGILLPSVSLAALAFWFVALTKPGELQPATAANPEEWEDAERMNEQLQKLSDSVTLTPHGVRRKR
jgi:hypothetical protein